jgi:hypothetical protein
MAYEYFIVYELITLVMFPPYFNNDDAVDGGSCYGD